MGADQSTHKGKEICTASFATTTPKSQNGCDVITLNLSEFISISKILNMKNMEYIKIDNIALANLKWVIVIFPNGHQKSSIGSFNIFLYILNMPSEWREITLCLSINSKQSMSSDTWIATYCANGENKGWRDRTLLLDELISLNVSEIAINIQINILHVILKHQSLYLYQYLNKDIIDASTKLQFINKSSNHLTWKIDQDLLNKFVNAYYRKSFESGLSADKMWRLRCYPNGRRKDSKGYLAIGLSLCYLFPNVKELKVKYSLQCKEMYNQQYMSVDQFCYGRQSHHGTATFFPITKLKLLIKKKKVKSLTFYCTINIISVQNKCGTRHTFRNWKKFFYKTILSNRLDYGIIDYSQMFTTSGCVDDEIVDERENCISSVNKRSVTEICCANIRICNDDILCCVNYW